MPRSNNIGVYRQRRTALSVTAQAMTADMVMTDSAGTKYTVLSSSYYAGLTDFRNVFNIGSTATTLRKMTYFDLTVTNGTFGPLSGTVLLSSISGMLLYKTVPGPSGAVQFVPANKNYNTSGSLGGTCWIYLTRLSYDATTKKAVYRIWEKQSGALSVTATLTAADTESSLTVLKLSDPIWAHHPTIDTAKFTSAETAAWYTLVLPGNQLKFVWRAKATNQV